jgi:pimeloyl-ACP methyl ester carboxylesterase
MQSSYEVNGRSRCNHVAGMRFHERQKSTHCCRLPREKGWTAVGHRVYWEECGNPDGKPALVIHGGPGSGAVPGWRRYFDPDRYRLILFAQRGCGRSTPYAGDTLLALEANTTSDLLADIERLRELRRVEQWLLFGGSWGVTLGLAYAQAHPDCVSEAVFFSITAGLRKELDWITRQTGRFFPEAWERFRNGVPVEDRDGDLADAYARLLASPDPAVRRPPATGAPGRRRTWRSAPARNRGLAARTPGSGWPSRASSPTTGVTNAGWMTSISLAGRRNLQPSRQCSCMDALTFPGRPMSPGSLVGRGAAPDSCYSTWPDMGQTSRA